MVYITLVSEEKGINISNKSHITLSVLVSDMKTELRGILKAEAATCATFVCNPCPISTPPCVTKTVPSV